MLLFGICDDSQSDKLHIENLINDYCINENYHITILSFENGEDLVNYYIGGKTAFDVIFLDIYMSGENGIKTAEQLRQYDSACKIIFTTSSTEHALESFGVFPFNYLIKPISEGLFNQVFEKALKTIVIEKQKRLSIKTSSNVQTVLYKDILFIESNGKTLNVHTTQGKIVSFYSKLDDTEKQINDKRFIRCHKSFLVNMQYILNVEDYSLKLTDSTRVPVTKRNFASIKKIFYDYLLNKANFKNSLDKVELT